MSRTPSRNQESGRISNLKMAHAVKWRKEDGRYIVTLEYGSREEDLPDNISGSGELDRVLNEILDHWEK